jgi:nucleotide-binding universal stress UspA family protein
MKILLATDGSENADTALDLLLQFPFPEQCTITLLNVIDGHLFVDPDAVGLDSEQHDAWRRNGETLREEVNQYLDRQAERVIRDGWTVTTMVRTGYVSEEILMAAGELQVDLVIVGAHGLSESRYFPLGSVAIRVLEYAPCSVLIVKQAAAESPAAAGGWRVLLAYDDSEPARKALSLCSSLPFGEQDKVIVVSVVTQVTSFRQDLHQLMNPISQQKKIAAKAALDGAVATLRGPVSNVTSRMLEGSNSAHEIIKESTATGCNLIMLGNKGKKALQRFLLGSMTGHVARHAPCSVWVVRD